MNKNDEKKNDAANASIDHPAGLRMDRERTQKFCRVLARMARAIHSLEAAAVHLQGFDVSAGRMDPGATVRAFSGTMSQDIDLVFQMLANEEDAEVSHD
jgi:hypothetical protein